MISVRGSIAVVLLGAVAAACGLFIGLEAPEGKPLPELPPRPPDPCAHAVPPEKPTAEDEGPDIPPFFLAVRRQLIGTTGTVPDAALPGFDLDGVCTCDPGVGTAFDASPSCVPRKNAKVQCDGKNGIDNEVERLFAPYGSVYDLNGINEKIDRGSATIIVYVANYNGRANDLSVQAGFASSDGLYTDECNPSLIVNDNPPKARPQGDTFFPASWRGCDKWHGVEGQFLGDYRVPATYVPKSLGKGYVRDGVLVLRGIADVPIFFGESTAQVQDPIFTSPLERVPTRAPTDPVRFRMKQATLAGRLSLQDLAKIAFSANFKGTFLCNEPALFSSLMESLCVGMDSAESTLLDHQGKPCESMSFAFRFDAEPADLDYSKQTPPEGSPNLCAGKPLPAPETLCPP
jgi:hypothetical protein